MKKKFLALMMSFVLVTTMVACGETDSEDSASDTGSSENSSEDVTDEEFTFDGMTIVDNKKCTIEITGIESGALVGDYLSVYLENKSEDTTYMFALEYMAVNDLEIPSIFAKEVAPGKKSNSEIDISTSSLSEAGITKYTDIELSFHVYDSDDWDADDVYEDTVHIYPYGEELAESYVRESQDEDIVLVDNKRAGFTVTGFDPDSISGYEMDIFLVNKTDTEVMISVDDVSVNGYMVDPFFATSLHAGNSKFSSVTWSSSDLEENGIETVEEIEFTIRVYDDDDWMADDFVNKVVVVNP